MFYFYFNLLYINVDLDPLPQFLYIPPTTSVFYLSLSQLFSLLITSFYLIFSLLSLYFFFVGDDPSPYQCKFSMLIFLLSTFCLEVSRFFVLCSVCLYQCISYIFLFFQIYMSFSKGKYFFFVLKAYFTVFFPPILYKKVFVLNYLYFFCWSLEFT